MFSITSLLLSFISLLIIILLTNSFSPLSRMFLLIVHSSISTSAAGHYHVRHDSIRTQYFTILAENVLNSLLQSLILILTHPGPSSLRACLIIIIIIKFYRLLWHYFSIFLKINIRRRFFLNFF